MSSESRSSGGGYAGLLLANARAGNGGVREQARAYGRSGGITSCRG
ncbi:hypothetical protein PCLA_04f0185 [Pseudomonas citronellolis]|nr:hypothetical protein PCLA_04f0185 [Pseudomonas citronellolis]